MKLTLDTNCIIDLEQDRPAATAIRSLVEHAERGAISLAIVGISASERQADCEYSQSFASFQEKVGRVGLRAVQILAPPMILDLTYFDWCVIAADETEDEVKRIHHILFPNAPYEYPGEDAPIPLQRRWRNRRCDALALWSHVHHGRDVFVTSDRQFLNASRRARLAEIGAPTICTPEDAAASVR